MAWTVLTVGQFAAVIAMLQRSSLGVATTDASARFGITAATLAAFSMVQLLVYAVLQVPVGVLIDQYGSKRLIVVGSLIMAGAQTMFAVATTLPLAFAARVALGVGDALTFISVMRLVPAWFPPERSAKLTTATGPVNQLGFVLSAVGFAALLAAAGWTPSFLVAAAVSVGSAALALVLLRDSPQGRPPRIPLGDALATAGQGVRQAWAEPGTRLGFWLGFMTLFTGMAFGVMWGYPFLTQGQGLSPGTAGVMMLALSIAALVYGVTLGSVLSRYPYYRSLIAIGVLSVIMVIWATVLLWPGHAPIWLLGGAGAGRAGPHYHCGDDLRHRPHVQPRTAVGQRDRCDQRWRVPRHGGRRHGHRAGPGGVQPHRIDRLLARLVQVGFRDPVPAVGSRHRADAAVSAADDPRARRARPRCICRTAPRCAPVATDVRKRLLRRLVQ